MKQPPPLSPEAEEEFDVNVAVRDVSAFAFTTHAPVPEHPPPDQPVKELPGSGVAVRVISVPSVKSAWQVVPQSIPDGELATVPFPETAPTL